MSSTPTLELVYFNGQGRAEISRLICTAGGLEFTDTRLTKEEFGAMKPSLPTGQLPILKIGDVVLPQSNAIEGYLATQAGLLPADALQAAQVYALRQSIGDMLMIPTKVIFSGETDEEKKAKAMADAIEKCKPWLARFEKAVADNGTGYFMGDKLGYGDIAIFYTVDRMMTIAPGLDAAYPALKGVHERVSANEKVAAYLATRPETPF